MGRGAGNGDSPRSGTVPSREASIILLIEGRFSGPKLEGPIEAADYENLHGAVTLKTEARSWLIVLAPPSRMANRGLTREMLKDGTIAFVEGYPHLQNEGELRAERITIAGKAVELR
jgi:uncharacterized protein (DUF1501 family)